MNREKENNRQEWERKKENGGKQKEQRKRKRVNFYAGAKY